MSNYPSNQYGTSGLPPQGYPPVPGQGYPPTQGQGFPHIQGQGYPVNQPPNQGFVPLNDADVPTAPALHELQKVPGYENVTFDSVPLSPPPYHFDPKPPTDRQDLQSKTAFTEEQVREALSEFVNDHCCYGKGPTEKLKIANIQMSSAIHYSLESFGEKRETSWKFEPYHGQALDTAMNGPAPQPWDVHVSGQPLFKNGKTKVEVPHTASLRPCHRCVGMGRIRCSTCYGTGYENCPWCTGGRKGDDICSSCSGSGRKSCFNCSGSGYVRCNVCNGKSELKCFVQLKVNWENHTDDYISDQTNLPSELVKTVTGDVVFEEQGPRVWPVTHSADPKINDASTTLVNKHAQAFPLERIMQQKHRVRVIPIGEITYILDGKQGNFHVYGFEHHVYFPDYPAKCCCGCTIL